MATHSSVLAWRVPGTGAWWAAVWGRTESDTTEAMQQQQQGWPGKIILGLSMTERELLARIWSFYRKV